MDKYILDRKDTVLLIVDIQERLIPAMKYKDEAIKGTNILIEACNMMDIPIIVTEQYPRGLGKTSESLEGLEKAKVFEKTRFTACIDEVVEELERLDRKKVIVVGMETHVCVFQTVRDLVGLGYHPFLAKDAVSSRGKDNTKNGLSLIREVGGLVSNVETILFDLMKDSKDENFREISALIK